MTIKKVLLKPNSINFKEAQNKQGVIDIFNKKLKNHVSLRSVEEWKEKLDINYLVGAILMDLSI